MKASTIMRGPFLLFSDSDAAFRRNRLKVTTTPRETLSA